MSKNRIRFYVALAIIFVVFNVIVFAVPFRHNAVFWLSYVFAVIAVGVQIYSYPKAFDFEGHDVRSKFYGFPLARLTTIYLILQLALSLLFMILAKFVDVKAWIPVVLYVILLGVFAVGFIAADTMKEEIERQDVVHKANVGTMRALQSKAVFVAGQCEDAETKKALDAFAEALRFSDPVSSDALADIEENLTGLVDELGNAVLDKDFAAAKTLCAKANSLLADRNRMCKLNK
ncbi:MAG: hypothetical protein IJH53_09925 [Oscillospiraceae bacterium]|nr:hypothetical protein [Oscillospiraceae bacterium]